MNKMIINMVIEDENGFNEYEFSSFAELAEKIDKGEIDGNACINTLYYNNPETYVLINWNREELLDRGFNTVNDIAYF